ncbi:MAG TPA: hypothetical protein VL503_01690, partial [Candidatus Omnitrophota bacterium]|nr:hypothetical protein [Candidatus Omnitrophota bacterium]
MGPLPARVSVFFVLSSILVPFSIAPARAQDSAPPADSSSTALTAPVAPSSETPRYLLPPIVVTAERAPVRLDRTPSDVTVVARERLDRAQA